MRATKIFIDQYFIKIAKLFKYLGNYSGNSFEIRIAKNHIDAEQNHFQCTSLFQSLIVGLFCSFSSGLSSNSSLSYNSSASSITATIPKNPNGSTGFEICRNFFFNHLVVLRVMKTRNQNDENIEIPASELNYYDTYLSNIEAYWTKYEANKNEDNAETYGLMKDIVEFAVKKLLIKSNNFLLEQLPVDKKNYAKPLLKYLSSISDKTFNFVFEDKDGDSDGRRLEQDEISRSNFSANFFNSERFESSQNYLKTQNQFENILSNSSRILNTRGIILNEQTTIEPFDYTPVEVLKEYFVDLTFTDSGSNKEVITSSYIDLIVVGNLGGFKFKNSFLWHLGTLVSFSFLFLV